MNDGEKDLTGMSQKNILLRTEQARIGLDFVVVYKIKKYFFKKHSDLLMS